MKAPEHYPLHLIGTGELQPNDSGEYFFDRPSVVGGNESMIAVNIAATMSGLRIPPVTRYMCRFLVIHIVDKVRLRRKRLFINLELEEQSALACS